MTNLMTAHINLTQPQIDFATSLYLEHLEEASALYEQRLTLFDDPELSWQDLEDFEDRFEPHIDGLVVGEELALKACKQQAIEGDFGELHAAMRVFCRQNRLDLVLETLEKIDLDDSENMQAVGDALNDELSSVWQNDFIKFLQDNHPKLTPILPKLFGYRRIHDSSTELLQALQNGTTEESFANITWALGRLREQKAKALLFNNYLQHSSETVRTEAALALLRLGEFQTVQHCLNQANSENWPFMALGLGGRSAAVSALQNITNSERVNSDYLIALGLLGDISSIELLLQHLPNADLAEAASQAFWLITGADLFEEVFIPEEIDEDELFEEELEKLKKGEPLYPPGEEPGITITRISQKLEDWQQWWAANKSRFKPRLRYRNGKLYSPSCLLETLQSEKSPRQIRQLAYEELVIRYNVDFPFETDMFVAQQRKVLAKYAEWIKANENKFKPGKWYFAGRFLG